MRLSKKIIISGKIVLKTGLHIGSPEGSFEIGTLDNPVIRDGAGRIYIPGSSLKGKMRSLLERTLFDISLIKNADNEKEIEDNNRVVWKKFGNVYIHVCNESSCKICKVFGRPGDQENSEPTRLFIDDAYHVAYLDEKGELITEVDVDTEVKGENTIDRLTSKANPRFFERVPAGSEFAFRMIIDVYDTDSPELFIETIVKAMKLLEDDYLGGSGSRGYGRIKFKDMKLIVKKVTEKDYVVVDGEIPIENLESLADTLKNVLESGTE